MALHDAGDHKGAVTKLAEAMRILVSMWDTYRSGRRRSPGRRPAFFGALPRA
jgi:hypothetical protein